MNEKSDYSCRSFKYEDEKEVKQLVKTCFGDFLNGEFWTWKYKLNPYFNPALVMVAEKNGTLIGCDHWLFKNFKLSPTLETRAILGADIAVHPEYRSKGVGKALIHALRSSEVLKNENPLIIYMFADPSLAKHFHSPAGGYIPAPDRTLFYLKILNWKKLEASVHAFNEQVAAGKFKDRLSKFELTVLFKMPHAPSLCLSLNEKGVTIGEKAGDNGKSPDVTISADLFTLSKIGAKEKKLLNVFKALLTRKLKIKGKLNKLLTFYNNVWVFQEIFSRKII